MRIYPFYLVALTAILSTSGCASDAGNLDRTESTNGGTNFVDPNLGGSSSSSPSATGGMRSSGATESGAVGNVSSGGASTQTTEIGGARNRGGGASSEAAVGGSETTTATQPSLGGTPATTAASPKGGASSTVSRSSSRGGAASAGGVSSAGGARTTGGSGGATSSANSASAGARTSTLSVTKFVGNITTGDTCDAASKTFSKHWNQITPENAGKWGSVQSSAGSAFNWRTLDAIYDYTQKNDVIFKEHAFIWGAQQPGGTINESAVKSWMTEFCKRYPNTKLIDVVNEPPPHTTPSYAASIGGGTNGDWKWITNAFTWARAACPDSILLLNDYNNIEWSADNTRFIDIVKKIKTAGAPIDAIGAQAHDLDNSSVKFSTVKTLLAKLNTETGLPVYITEYDISTTDDTAQLNTYKEQIPYFLSTSYVHGITVWGWIFGRTWSQAPDSGLIRNGTARPAMTWLMQELGRPAP